MLPSDQWRVTEQTKFSYIPLGKALEKQTKIIADEVKRNKSNSRAWKTIGWI